MNGKLLNRALDPPVRDVYDVAVCGIEDSESLEIAVNGIYEAAIDSRILGWKMNREKHAEYAAEQVLGVPTRLQAVKTKPRTVRDPRRRTRVVLPSDHWVRLFFVGGPISLFGGGEAGGNWIRQGVVRSGGGSGGRRYFCRQRPMGDFRWSSRAS